MTRWERALPYFLGAIFGLSITLFVISAVMFRKAVEERPILSFSERPTGSDRVAAERNGAIVEATRRVSPAVVSITALRKQLVRNNQWLMNQWLNRFFHSRRIPQLYREQKYSIFGSGVIVNPDGYILTNEHVISDADEIFVTISDGTEITAAVIGSAPEFDLALLKIEARNLPYATVGDSDSLQIGEWVIAIGSPFGYLLNDTQPTVTVGVISALGRDVKSNPETSEAVFKNMIQTDAAINPGNSGGPLVSSSGEVIGINTFIFSAGDGGNLGMGFAIPINAAKMVIEEITAYGHVRSVWTGLEVRELTPDMAQRLDLAVSTGLFVERIVEGSPAERAGMKVGDVIIEVNGVKIVDTDQANRTIFGLTVGETLNMRLLRGDELLSVDLTLEERPGTI